MSKKKHNPITEEIAIDKVDSFVEKNFKKILLGVAVVILAVLVGYGVKSYMNKKYAKSLNELGGFEIAFANGKMDKALIDQFVQKGKSVSEVKDYVLMRGMELYADIGLKNKVESLANENDKKFKELSDGLLSDLNIQTDNDEKYLTDSYLEPVWYYRAILHADKDKRKMLYKEFKTKFPDSKLLRLIENWGLNS